MAHKNFYKNLKNSIKNEHFNGVSVSVFYIA